MTAIGPHASERIDIRTAHTNDEIRRLVTEQSILINRQSDGRTWRLFYAPLDDAYFIAVVAVDQTLVTVMPSEWVHVAEGSAFFA